MPSVNFHSRVNGLDVTATATGGTAFWAPNSDWVYENSFLDRSNVLQAVHKMQRRG